MRVAVDAEAVPEGLQENLQVEAETPPLDVVEITLDPLLDRCVAPPAVERGPARDPRLHLVAEHVAGHAAPELLHEARALGARSDEAHLAAQHVEELGQLVEARASQEDAERRAAWVVRARPYGPGLRLGVHAPRPELQHPETPPVYTHALLVVQNGPRRRELEPDGDRQHDRRGDRQTKSAEDQVERPLENAVQAVEPRFPQVDEGDHLELLDPSPRRHETEDVGDQVDRDRTVAEPTQPRGEPRGVGMRERDEYDVHLLAVEHRAHVLDAAEPA